jgi:DNA-directed RNA polymerase specialized sigma54-like protein
MRKQKREPTPEAVRKEIEKLLTEMFNRLIKEYKVSLSRVRTAMDKKFKEPPENQQALYDAMATEILLQLKIKFAQDVLNVPGNVNTPRAIHSLN